MPSFKSIKESIKNRVLPDLLRVDIWLIVYNAQMEAKLEEFLSDPCRKLGQPAISEQYQKLVQSFNFDTQYVDENVEDSHAFRKATVKRAKRLYKLAKAILATVEDNDRGETAQGDPTQDGFVQDSVQSPVQSQSGQGEPAQDEPVVSETAQGQSSQGEPIQSQSTVHIDDLTGDLLGGSQEIIISSRTLGRIRKVAEDTKPHIDGLKRLCDEPGARESVNILLGVLAIYKED
ncbi:hypothetical protein K461DRAFT_267909 [Myriangium duriaei CBS 260.36]|uniref:Uncharacterized protein n=1 Tax=Myriangium duriaei CBS 260.36 TaxID=1168546 RepID=A0A9P4MKM8_9PEZI|nr:hypothetical protein K461DRAFT_267909 [Myriangium duriaei CBS 260.36]